MGLVVPAGYAIRNSSHTVARSSTGLELRVEDEREVDVGGQLLQEAPADAGLAGPHLTGELDEAAVLSDAVDQVRERLAVTPLT